MGLKFLKKIYKKCNEDRLQSAEDMQHALEEIRGMIKEKYPQVTKPAPSMILHCPKDGAKVEYDDILDLFICTECEWAGLYHETIKPYDK
jgi:hypothetical protein